ncbi:hypothetical protein EA462_09250 [Natrarchaeobius halalkaliphilus]|uniref:Blue (type 1) copper domain-containing protein n=1 Tax=Natrarchaeobius halalkaliphilus TaxID=1679091 RepID=A0A3N6LSC2_9EURY|nr:hypothetical protein [Natrarchaeobius halalkaliphilus]RQG90164.1 hypothetical protein EA462_09250 [Natrarchaeobius halalkaliphilus]
MTPSETDRRTILRHVGATLAGSLSASAGCLDRNTEPRTDDADEPIVEEAEATALEGDADPDAWTDVESIRLDGYVGGWVGVEPPHIDRIENPTLVLFDGSEYEITWMNRDGVKHNLALHDVEETVVGEYATGVTEEIGATTTLEFVARSEMVRYICEHQPAIQYGSIDVVDG